MDRIRRKSAEVDISKPATAGLLILLALNAVATKMNLDFIITAGRNGKHAVNSKHYTGEAYDVQSKQFDDSVQEQVLLEMKALLGGAFFTCILEDYDLPNEHFHFQKRKGVVDVDTSYILTRFLLSTV